VILKVIVTGAAGMLGHDLCGAFGSKDEVKGLAREALDITDREKVIALARELKPQVIINSAALADVDYCERNPEEAFRVNSEGAKNVADAANAADALLVHISTDYVFDGEKGSAYTEDDSTNPINVYGKSKLAAEECIVSSGGKYAIIRSSWLFGPAGKNFVDSVIEAARSGGKFRAIKDKLGGPTYTADLVDAIRGLSVNILQGEAPSGIYNISNSGICSRYQFAKEILESCGLDAEVVPISAEEAGGPAPRPRITELDNTKIACALRCRLRHYREALKDYIKRKRGHIN
jgi:dTDP-4-dehydrorhamnose reductase